MSKPAALRILVVDDDRDTLWTLTTLLSAEGHEVRSAGNGREALETAVAFLPDAVLLDIALPEMNGYEVARKIRTRLGNRPKLIGISGQYRKGADRILAEVNGFDHYLLKPYDPKEVLALLDTVHGGQVQSAAP